MEVVPDSDTMWAYTDIDRVKNTTPADKAYNVVGILNKI